MATNYDYVLESEPKKVMEMRGVGCLAGLLSEINTMARLSVFGFPQGIVARERYNTVPAILPEFATKEQSGAERWAQFLSTFVPGTSYMESYDEKPSIEGKNPMCEFRLEQYKNFRVSAIIRQCWLNGVRYCLEDYSAEIPRFCLYYWREDMRPYQAFQLYLLAHQITDSGGHKTGATNAHFCDEAKYRELLTEDMSARNGTYKLGRENKRNRNYEVKFTELAKATQKAYENKEAKQEAISFEELVALWRKDKQPR